MTIGTVIALVLSIVLFCILAGRKSVPIRTLRNRIKAQSHKFSLVGGATPGRRRRRRS